MQTWTQRILLSALTGSVALLAAAGAAQAQVLNALTNLHLEAATRNTGGDAFLKNWTRDRYCMYVDNPTLLANIRTQTARMPMVQIFDDVWFNGFQNVGQFIMKNSNGFVMVDSLNSTADANNYIVPALTALGVSSQFPVQGIYLTHGHGDHDGGALRLRQVYGADFPIYMGSGDGAGKTYTPTVVDSGNLGYQSIMLGDRPVTLLSSPGHTPGTMSAFIPVRDNGKEQLLMVVGGTAIPTNTAASRQYLASVERMYAAARDLGAVGTLHPHGIIDGGNQHQADIVARGSRTPNPYILGNEKMLRTLAIMRECGAAQVAQVDATATAENDPVWRVTSIAYDTASPSTVKLAARLQSDWGPVAGQTVTFNVRATGAACTATTDANGLATCATLPTLRAGDVVTASFPGNSGSDFVNLPALRTAAVSSLSCDVDGNGRVDRNDISAIVAAIGRPIPSGDPRDADANGRVTVDDARLCTARCTKEQCVP